MVEYIEYKKKKYPIRVSYYALKMTRKDTGQTEDGLVKSMSVADRDAMEMVEMYESLLWYALVAGAEVDGTELDIPREKMEFVLDECFQEFLALVEKFYPSEEAPGKKIVPVGNRQQRRTKKKLVEVKKTPT